MDRKTFKDTEKIVKESWAMGVELELTRMVYKSYHYPYSRLDYTGVVQDMIDEKDTTVSHSHSAYETNNSTKIYVDQVNGYTIRQIEDALKGQKTWNGWRDNIKNRYSNGTEKHLDAAFAYWNSK